MPKDFVTYEGKKVKFTGEVRRPRTGELYQYADGSICKAVSVKNSYPILEYVDKIDQMLAEHDVDRDDFYMVQAENTSSTSKRHYSGEIADSEAQRLASDSPGVKFYILQTIGYYEVEKPEPTFTTLARGK